MLLQKSGSQMKAADILELMRLKGWNQADLARSLELSEGAVTRWLKNEHQPMGPTRILLRQWLEAARRESHKPIPA